jgi:hypothetical protein
MGVSVNQLRVLWIERKYHIRKRREALLMAIAWRLPRELVMWCYVRVASHATTGQFSDTVVPELGMVDALHRWDQPR